MFANGAMRMKWVRIPISLLVCAIAAGCAGVMGPRTAGPGPAGPPLTARHGAPTAFSRTGIPLPSAVGANTSPGGAAPVVLNGYSLFVATGTSMSVMNAVTGQAAGSEGPAYTVLKPPAGTNSPGDAPATPLVVSVGGQRVTLAGYVVQIPGEGTVAPSVALELDAVDASARRLWEILAPLPGQPSDLAGDPTVSLVGSAGDAAVAVVGDAGDGYRTVAFDLAGRKAAWQDPSFVAGAVGGNTVVGTTDDASRSGLGSHSEGDTLYVSGVGLRTGKTEWRRSGPVSGASVAQAGPREVLVEAIDASSGKDVISLLSAGSGTGTVIAAESPSFGSQSLPWTCRFDGRRTVVCGSSQGDHAFAVDGETGDTLWKLPDQSANRVAPDITAVYDGMVYGTTANGPLVLNARTGKDVNDSPGIAPVAVDPDVGIADTASSGLEAYLATG